MGKFWIWAGGVLYGGEGGYWGEGIIYVCTHIQTYIYGYLVCMPIYMCNQRETYVCVYIYVDIRANRLTNEEYSYTQIYTYTYVCI